MQLFTTLLAVAALAASVAAKPLTCKHRQSSSRADPAANSSPAVRVALPSPANPAPSSTPTESGIPSGCVDNYFCGVQSDGDGTFFTPGLGACGIENTPEDFIVAVSHDLFDNYPGYGGGNPNNNPVCGRMIQVSYQGNSVLVKVEDRCGGCVIPASLDFSPAAFDRLAPEWVGRLHNISWHWV